MINRLSKFIDKNKILSKHQYGFRKNRSTEHAIIDFVDKFAKAIDKGKYSVGVFLDFSKAFDTINYRILIKKLEHYGIREWPKNGLKIICAIENKLLNIMMYNRR
jgi:retron-type reverse transcriptase